MVSQVAGTTTNIQSIDEGCNHYKPLNVKVSKEDLF